MMNCGSDPVEFYSAAPRKPSETVSASESVFCEAKHRKKISYTEDGRKMIDGVEIEAPEDVIERAGRTPEEMWRRLIVKAAATDSLKTGNGSSTPSEADSASVTSEEIPPSKQIHKST
uniref:Uncharacterized protein n=1 Tax=Panagrellus redivivus TaxID=6233 RepID=A0A7E4VEY7_PANRE